MDIGGPKIRIGEIKRGPKVKHIQLSHDESGGIIEPAVIHLVPGKTYDFDTEHLPVDAGWLELIQTGDIISTKGTVGKQAVLQVREKSDDTVIVHSFNSIYVSTGTVLQAEHGYTCIGDIPALEQTIYLKNEDILELYKNPIEGCPANFDSGGKINAPPIFRVR